jgi:hypothetical protein
VKNNTDRLALVALALLTAVALSSCSLFGNETVTLTGGGGALSTISNVDLYVSTAEVGKVVAVQEVQFTFSGAGGDHGPAYDVAIELISPGGKNVTVFDNYNSSVGSAVFEGGSTYTFVDENDDDGLNQIVTYPSGAGVVVPWTYQADGDFDDFEGWDLKGTWTLRFRVYNSPLASAGTISSWRVIIEYEDEY